jgi:hypothetical protein
MCCMCVARHVYNVNDHNVGIIPARLTARDKPWNYDPRASPAVRDEPSRESRRNRTRDGSVSERKAEEILLFITVAVSGQCSFWPAAARAAAPCDVRFRGFPFSCTCAEVQSALRLSVRARGAVVPTQR